MGTLTDSLTIRFPGTSVPRALATSAIVRCNDLLDLLLRQIVVDGGPGTRQSGFGLYEMMHAVEDSFSYAHAERTPDGDRLPPRLEADREDRRDPDRAREQDSRRRLPQVGRPPGQDVRRRGRCEGCEKRTDHPYDVPYGCLSAEGDRARQAIVELLVLVRDLRLAQRAAPPGTDTRPETSPEWREYRAKWFTPVHPCEGAECAVRQPPETVPGKYAFLGVDTRFETPGTFEVTARGSVLRYAEGLNPFVYSVSASLGYQYRKEGGSAGVAGLGVGLVLPLGLKADIGLTAAELRTVFGGSGGGLRAADTAAPVRLRAGRQAGPLRRGADGGELGAARRPLVGGRGVELRALLAERRRGRHPAPPRGQDGARGRGVGAAAGALRPAPGPERPRSASSRGSR